MCRLHAADHDLGSPLRACVVRQDLLQACSVGGGHLWRKSYAQSDFIAVRYLDYGVVALEPQKRLRVSCTHYTSD